MTTAANQSICGYAVREELSAGRDFLACDSAGRQVVLKLLDSDCLLDGDLHPSIRERLSRLRELASRSVANLLGVERDGNRVFVVWEHIEGRPFVDAACDQTLTSREVARLLRELILAVESMHVLGIVHGALGAGTVLVDRAGLVRLTHVSPLLHHDESRDLDAVAQILRQVIDARDERNSPLGRSVYAATADHASVRPLATRLMSVSESDDVPVEETEELQETRDRRRRTFVMATLVAVIGVAFAIGVYRVARSTEPATVTPPVVK